MKYLSSCVCFQLVQKTRDAYFSGKTRPLKWRIHQIKQLKRMLEENKEQFHSALKSDLRRVLFFSTNYYG